VESKLEDEQCGFRPGRSTTDQVFTLKQIFEKSCEYGKDLFACFVLRPQFFKSLRPSKTKTALSKIKIETSKNGLKTKIGLKDYITGCT